MLPRYARPLTRSITAITHRWQPSLSLVTRPLYPLHRCQQQFTKKRSFHTSRFAVSTAPAPASASASPAPSSASVSIQAYYAPSLDKIALERAFPNQTKFTRPECSIIALHTTHPNTAINFATDPYCAVFSFGLKTGAVVFFNCTESDQERIFALISHEPQSRIKTDSQDDYTVLIQPSAAGNSSEFHCAFEIDRVSVSWLDAYSVRVISQILAQTVGVAHYERVTSSLLEEFLAISQTQSRTGSLASLSSPANIVRIIGTTNSILTVMLSHIRVLDASELVWRHGEFNHLWDGLRSEFDLENRYEVIETKLKTLHDNQNLFLELLHADKSTRMEIIIIVLIAMEVILSIVFHSPLVPWLSEKLGLASSSSEETKKVQH